MAVVQVFYHSVSGGTSCTVISVDLLQNKYLAKKEPSVKATMMILVNLSWVNTVRSKASRELIWARGTSWRTSAHPDKYLNTEIDIPKKLLYPRSSFNLIFVVLTVCWLFLVDHLDIATPMHKAWHIIQTIIIVTVNATKVNTVQHKGRRISGYDIPVYLHQLPRDYQVQRPMCLRNIKYSPVQTPSLFKLWTTWPRPPCYHLKQTKPQIEAQSILPSNWILVPKKW